MAKDIMPSACNNCKELKFGGTCMKKNSCSNYDENTTENLYVFKCEGCALEGAPSFHPKCVACEGSEVMML
jgi:hypothetical protein